MSDGMSCHAKFESIDALKLDGKVLEVESNKPHVCWSDPIMLRLVFRLSSLYRPDVLW